MAEGFFSRWSRRKQEAGVSSLPAATPASVASDPVDRQAPAPATGPEPAQEPELQPANLPTLEDVQTLTPQSDFQPFMQRGVGHEVRNAAMKKLFADPHFNIMDGLDVYIDDYSLPDPMPAEMLGKMASAQFLKLVPEPIQAQGQQSQDPDSSEEQGRGTQVVAQSPGNLAHAAPTPNDHPDLQLQPDPAPADTPPGQRAG